MIRGETRKITITGFPVSVASITNLIVIYKQMGEVILQKDISDCEKNTSTNSIAFSLTQEESLSLNVGKAYRSVIFIADGARYEAKHVAIDIKETAYPEILEE